MGRNLAQTPHLLIKVCVGTQTRRPCLRTQGCASRSDMPPQPAAFTARPILHPVILLKVSLLTYKLPTFVVTHINSDRIQWLLHMHTALYHHPHWLHVPPILLLPCPKATTT